MSETIFIEEITDAERRLKAGEYIVTLQNTMSDEHIGKVIRKKLSTSNGASITVEMVDGDPDQQ